RRSRWRRRRTTARRAARCGVERAWTQSLPWEPSSHRRTGDAMSVRTVGRVTLDATDQQLLNLIQTEFPLTTRPFAALGERLGESEAAVMARYQRLKDDRIIRQVSAIFDTRKLGYHSSLVASAVDERRVDEAAEVINAHPGVSHNYRRDHEFNLWWTVAVPPGM